MSIQAEMSELKGLKLELKKINSRAKTLRKRIKAIEATVLQYIEEKNLPGIKHKGVAVRLERKTKRAIKNKKQKEHDMMDVLAEYGLRDPEKALRKLMDASRGDEEEVSKLKIKDIK